MLAYAAGGYDVATHAVPGLLRGRFDTDVLMLAAATGAAILGEFAEGAFLLFLFALGHAGEHYALDRARNAVNALGELMPKTARRKRGESIEEVPGGAAGRWRTWWWCAPATACRWMGKWFAVKAPSTRPR